MLSGKEKDKEEKQLPEKIAAFYGIAKPNEKHCTIKLYKITKTRGRPLKEFLEFFENELVDDVFVKENFGPGNYEGALLDERGNIMQTKPIHVAGDAKTNQMGELERFTQTLTALVSAATPIIELLRGPKTKFDQLDNMIDKFTSATISSMSRVQNAMYKQLEPPAAQTPKEAQMEVGKEIALKFVDFLAGFADKYKQSGPIRQEIYKQGLKQEMNSDPKMKQAMEDPQVILHLYDGMRSHEKIGPELTDELFQSLGLTVEQTES